MTAVHHHYEIARNPRLGISELTLASWTVLHTAGSLTWNEERPSLVDFSLQSTTDHLAIPRT